ncbi:N-ATPase subunit AtpR [Neoroseomonas lacus]|uniref:ATP synthase subunit I n=1 Tax=Neoroseomonas lacus TaxID=287609 RepID=A0A917KYG0_9PROT|nr:ATP synthase subunit I [Neoroseomonas lacus]GGJ33280.1 hypothetical protein GCM10011320_46190 [Neoroseomonas lacus]
MIMLAEATAAAAAGLLAGGLFFLAMRHNAEMYLSGGPAWRPAVLHLARLLLLGALLVAAVRVAGGAGLLGAFAGFLAARSLALRAWRPQP